MVSNEIVQNVTINNSFAIFGHYGIPFYDDVLKEDPVNSATFCIKIIISILMGLSMVIGIFGNICTCTVIVQDRSMRTPTNCYLANLAVTDLLISLFIPIEIYVIWMPHFYPFGEVGCRSHFIILEWFWNCNLFIITAFTIERYIVITKPFLRQKMQMNSRVFKIVAVIWILSLVFCLPNIIYVGLLERKKYVFCYYSIAYMPGVLIGLQMLVFFALPLTIIVVLYILIIIELKKPDNGKLRNDGKNARQNRDKAVKMVAVITTAFLIFWMPYWLLRMMMTYPYFKYEDNYYVWMIVNYVSYNGYTSTAVNPFIYSLVSQQFRQAFIDILKRRRSLRQRARSRKALLQICTTEHAVALTTDI